ncbi:TPA: TraC family protein [Salmonella enterica]|nr:TraC family protein [Salmonella enterica]HEA0268246.1 TraC family protein [Salmonella enterica]HEA0295778.1 TraC family protein [Salmonella enterica]HEA0309237.1 TraC family protein [Salmonella enterica]HEA0336628.1 TraC family protein [Salmonella enterica]
MFSLFSGKRSKSVPRILHPSGREPLKREGKLTRRDEAKIYAHGPSFIDFLPWVEYLPEDECLLLDDGVSVGAVFSLTMPPDEIEQVARFRSLTEEQKQMLASAKKGQKVNGIPCYTEGVVMGSNLNALFRSVPPSLYLALGMTEKDEKAQRRELMKAHGCTELEAAFMVARELDRRRGTGVVNET